MQIQMHRATQRTSLHRADDVTRVDLMHKLETLRQANRRRNRRSAEVVNPFPLATPAEVAHNVNFLMAQMASYRGSNIGDLRLAAERRLRFLVGIEGAVFAAGLFFGMGIYFAACLLGASAIFAALGMAITLGASAIVPLIHQRVLATKRVRQLLAKWSHALYAHRASYAPVDLRAAA